MYKVCTNSNGERFVSTSFSGSCFAWTFNSESEALAECAGRSDCKGVVYSPSFGSNYQYIPVHVSPVDNPGSFGSGDSESYFVVRDCSVLLDASPVHQSENEEEQEEQENEETDSTDIFETTELPKIETDKDFTLEMSLFDKNGRIKIGYTTGKCLTIEPHIDWQGNPKADSTASKIVAQPCDQTNVHQTFIPIALADAEESFLICSKPIFENSNVYWCLYNKNNMIKWAKVSDISAVTDVQKWTYSATHGKLFNVGKGVQVVYNVNKDKIMFNENSILNFVGNLEIISNN